MYSTSRGHAVLSTSHPAWRLAPDVLAPKSKSKSKSKCGFLRVEHRRGNGENATLFALVLQESQINTGLCRCCVLGCFNDSFRHAVSLQEASGVSRWSANGRRAYLHLFEILKRKRRRVSLWGPARSYQWHPRPWKIPACYRIGWADMPRNFRHHVGQPDHLSHRLESHNKATAE